MQPASVTKSKLKARNTEIISSRSQSKKIHSAIDDCFDTIMIAIDNPSVIHISLQWVNEILHTQEASLNAIIIAVLFNRLATADFLWWEGEPTFHNEARELLAFSLSILAIYLKKQTQHCSFVLQDYSKPHFTLRELCEILETLPKLPIKWQESSNKLLLNMILNKILNALKQNEQQDRDIVMRNLPCVASALARLKFRPVEHEELIKYLLFNIEASAIYLFQQSRETQSQIWQYLAVLQARGQALSEQHGAIFEQLKLQLEQTKEMSVPQLTQLQQGVTEQLRRLCTPEALEDLKIEYLLGCYSMDIAFPKHKLNFEIDGKHHYLEGNILRFSDQIRDFILNKLEGFCVIRIPYYEWSTLLTEESRAIYLRDKLEKNYCSSILNPAQIAYAYQQQRAGRQRLIIVRPQAVIASLVQPSTPPKPK